MLGSEVLEVALVCSESGYSFACIPQQGLADILLVLAGVNRNYGPLRPIQIYLDTRARRRIDERTSASGHTQSSFGSPSPLSLRYQAYVVLASSTVLSSAMMRLRPGMGWWTSLPARFCLYSVTNLEKIGREAAKTVPSSECWQLNQNSHVDYSGRC